MKFNDALQVVSELSLEKVIAREANAAAAQTWLIEIKLEEGFLAHDVDQCEAIEIVFDQHQYLRVIFKSVLGCPASMCTRKDVKLNADTSLRDYLIDHVIGDVAPAAA